MNFQQQSPCRNGSPFPVEKGLKAFTASSLLLLASCLLLGRAAPALNTVLGSLSVASQPHSTAQVGAPPRAGESQFPSAGGGTLLVGNGKVMRLAWAPSACRGGAGGLWGWQGRDHRGIIPYPVPSDAD